MRQAACSFETRSDLAGTDSQENSQRLKRTLKSRFKIYVLFGIVRAML